MAALAQSRGVTEEARPIPVRGEFRLQSDRVEKLAVRLENTADPEVRAIALDLVKSVIELHGSALARFIDSLQRTREGEEALAEALHDDLVAAMLLLHSLHPDPLEVRVQRGLEKARSYLQSHGGDVELLSTEGGIIRLRLHGACGSCNASSTTLKSAVQEALFEVAPDIVEVVAENSPVQDRRPQLVTLR